MAHNHAEGLVTQNLIIMQAELESHHLDVQLVPLNPKLRNYNEGGCRRVVADRNATWYRQLCARHLSSRRRNHRKPDTKIKRRNVERLLGRLVAGLPTRSKYAAEIMRMAERRAA